MVWVLYVCMAVAWGSCRMEAVSEHPSRAVCYEEMAFIKAADQARGTKHRVVVALCQPKTTGVK